MQYWQLGCKGFYSRTIAFEPDTESGLEDQSNGPIYVNLPDPSNSGSMPFIDLQSTDNDL